MKRVLITLTSLVLMIVYTQASKCKKFTCGTIAHNETATTNRTCVEPKSDLLAIAEECPSSYICGAWKWDNPSQASKESKCELDKRAELLNNTSLPGDICLNNTHCINNAKNFNCTGGMCISPYKNQSTCENVSGGAGHQYCPTGYYCKSKKCTPTLGLGKVCTDGEDCKFGLACIATNGPKYDNFTCQAFNSLNEGDIAEIKFLTYPGDIWMGINNLCKSNHAIKVTGKETQYTCRKGDTSTDVEEKDLRREESGKICTFLSYNNGSDATKFVNKTDYSSCGFNKDDGAYCIKRKGDKWFNETYSAIAKIDLTTFDCHVESTVEKCYDAMKKMDKKLHGDYFRALLAVSPTRGHHLYANNDNCIAKTITKSFWQEKLPDSAMNLGTISMLLFALIGFVYLF